MPFRNGIAGRRGNRSAPMPFCTSVQSFASLAHPRCHLRYNPMLMQLYFETDFECPFKNGIAGRRGNRSAPMPFCTSVQSFAPLAQPRCHLRYNPIGRVIIQDFTTFVNAKQSVNRFFSSPDLHRHTNFNKAAKRDAFIKRPVSCNGENHANMRKAFLLKTILSQLSYVLRISAAMTRRGSRLSIAVFSR